MLSLCQNFRGFEFRGVPNVSINCEIQEVPVMDNKSPNTHKESIGYNKFLYFGP